MMSSKADLWVFVLSSLTDGKTHFFIIPPKELLRRIAAIHGDSTEKVQCYFSVTKSSRCWETRGLNEEDQKKLISDHFVDENRNFSQFLNNWLSIERLKG